MRDLWAVLTCELGHAVRQELTCMMTKLMKKFEDVVSAAPRMSGVAAGTSRTRRILLKILPP